LNTKNINNNTPGGKKRATARVGKDAAANPATTETKAEALIKCNGCDKEVAGGAYILNVFYCPMCASYINKNNADAKRVSIKPEKVEPTSHEPFTEYKQDFTPDCCKNCSNNPKNNPNASGFCNCALPYIAATGLPSWAITSTTRSDIAGMIRVFIVE